jgi:CO/xanthine dehydrogenase FAD-binding subunit
MKAAPFEYARPMSLDEACALLAADDGARVIAGGQTLVPLMAMRLARPTLLVDIARIPGLAGVRDGGDAVTIGAMTRQVVLDTDPLVRAKLPLLAKAIHFVGHAPTRARGTVGGSIANADPAAEIALCAVTLGATLTWREAGRNVGMPASEFFVGPMVTALPEAACLAAVHFPVWPEPRVGVGFHEVNARQSDFAFAAAAAQVAVDADGKCTHVAVGIGAASAFPVRLYGVAEALKGTRAEEARVREALRAAIDTIDIIVDPHASVAYRKRAALALGLRAVADAYAATGGAHAR